MNYGFLINNDRCIGCHACSTACKSENEVPLGVQRTWVKSVETGRYPEVRRSFQVTRCNHCANPPCVKICPVTAMYQCGSGIVEFDRDVCIGCKACMQACPYDAIHIDPESKTAAKCHFCAHRIDIGLEPSCVVVCPENAILAGDLADPETEIARTIAESAVSVRRPEQGTVPKLYYLGGGAAAMDPGVSHAAPATFAWVDVLPVTQNGGTGDGLAHGTLNPIGELADKPATVKESRSRRYRGESTDGPAMIGDPVMAEQMVQIVYNAQHKIPWHWPVPAYLVTKAIGAGLFMILSLGAMLGFFHLESVNYLTAGFLSLMFMGITTGLLIFDLERPERFLRILIRPQWKSWLVRGAYILVGFSVIVALWFLAEFAAWTGWIDAPLVESARPVLLWIGFPLALGSTAYTAFLFGQAKGRDLWQSPLLPVHLIIQAFLAGAAAVLVTGSLTEMGSALVGTTRVIFSWALALDLLVTLMGDVAMPHASAAARRAASEITQGRYARTFWVWGIFAGRVVPLVLLLYPGVWIGAAGGLLALVGLYAYEHVFVVAPQEIQNN